MSRTTSLSPRCLAPLGFLLLFVVVALLVFHALWPGGTVLLTSDDNVGLIAANQRVIAASPLAHWTGEALWGMPGLQGFHLWALAMRILSAEAFMNLYHGLCLALSAWLLALYLRDKGLRPAACVFGGLVAFWVGTNLTLTYAGHVGKYGLMIFLSLAVFALGRWGKTGRMAWSVLAGAAAGAMFLEQSDVALFCALLLVPLGLFEAAQAAGGWQIVALAKKSWAAALAAVLLAGGASLSVVGAGVTEVPKAEDPAAHWAYITQWSQPPGESLDFIAPGWTGWRSGDEKGPYWGKMGSGPGMMNFKLENVYVGAIPLLFAVLGLADAFRRRKEKDGSGTVFLWGGLCGLALLLAFGKFFPLYKPLSLLPGFASIRNPNKFIHFFQMAWGVVAAFGLEAALRMDRRAARKWHLGRGDCGGPFPAVGVGALDGPGGGRGAPGGGGVGSHGSGHPMEQGVFGDVCGRGAGGGRGHPVAGVGKKFPPCGKKVSTVWKKRGKSSTVWKKSFHRVEKSPATTKRMGSLAAGAGGVVRCGGDPGPEIHPNHAAGLCGRERTGALSEARGRAQPDGDG